MNKKPVLSKEVENILKYARNMATTQNYHYTGTEHLLLGVLEEETGKKRVREILSNLGFNLESLHEEAAQLLKSDQLTLKRFLKLYMPTPPKIKRLLSGKKRPMALSERAKEVLVFATGEAELLHETEVQVEHLLLGLLHEKEGFASIFLRKKGLEEGKLRQFIQNSRPNWKKTEDLPTTPPP